MGVVLGDIELNRLPTKVNYYHFDNESGNCENVHFSSTAKVHLKQQTWINDVSDKILKALCYVYKKSLITDFDKSICNYLYYWLSDTLYTNTTYHLTNTLIMDVLNFLLKSNEGKNICVFPNHELNQTNFKDIKLIFDYAQDYNNYKLDLLKPNSLCTKPYKDYLDIYVRTYNKIYRECSMFTNKPTYCTHLDNYFKIENNYDLKTFSCDIVQNISDLKTQQNDHYTEAQQHEKGQLSVILPNEKKTIGKDQSHVDIGKQEIIIYHEEHKGTRANKNQQPLIHSSSSDSYFISEQEELSMFTNISDNPSASSSSKSVAAVPLVIGITVFSILLCKFTPVGYWLKKALLGKSKRKRNIIMDRNIIEDYTIPEDLDSPRRFNVSDGMQYNFRNIEISMCFYTVKEFLKYGWKKYKPYSINCIYFSTCNNL